MTDSSKVPGGEIKATFKVKLDILEYWQAGSGRGRGALYDSEVVRTQAGLPYLPGKTLRGLIREGMTLAAESAFEFVKPEAVAALFGDADRFGYLHVTNATLGADMEKWAMGQNAEIVGTLFTQISATAIEPGSGMASDHSLRTVEAAVPLELSADLHLMAGSGYDEAKVLEMLQVACGLIRGLGKTRRRGFGRVAVSVENGDARGEGL